MTDLDVREDRVHRHVQEEADLMTPVTPIVQPPFPRNFGRLVLGYTDIYDSEQRRILQQFSRSTRFSFTCTLQLNKIIFAGIQFPQILRF